MLDLKCMMLIGGDLLILFFFLVLIQDWMSAEVFHNLKRFSNQDIYNPLNFCVEFESNDCDQSSC